MAIDSNKIKRAKEIAKQEYIKCATNPIYFCNNYVKVQNPIKGNILFKLYPFQEDALYQISKNKYNLILKARQMGISTLVSAYALWVMNFYNDKNILIISISQDIAKTILTRIRFAYNQLPSWMRRKCTEDNRLSLRLDNGSQTTVATSTSASGRSAALSLLIIDECAFISNIDEIWTSAQPTLSTGGSCIILSTPNGVGNFFHKRWISSSAGNMHFNCIKMPWHLHPERDQAWRNSVTEMLGEKDAAQECDCEFESSGNAIISNLLLNEYRKAYAIEPIEKRGKLKDFWIWKKPEQNKKYIISADTSRGDGTDFSAFQVLDTETIEQCAEFKGKLNTKDYGNLLIAIAVEYNNALIVPESNNIGWATIQQIINRGYQNLFYSTSDLTIVNTNKNYSNSINTNNKKMLPGFCTSVKTRPLIISKLIEYFNSRTVIVHSERLLDELSVFVWENGKAQAMRGFNDDLVMALGIGYWVRDTSLRIQSETNDFSRLLLSSINYKDYQHPNYNLQPHTTNQLIYSSANSEQVATRNWKFNIDTSNNLLEYFDMRELLSPDIQHKINEEVKDNNILKSNIIF